ncbi:MAG: hypothetical protein F4227_02825 [Gammaproteobacteria bacterium]|nr:hypothetical protein [Gammaproteobacteria bacterium]MYF01931.1 hypothetical protein [Gammaproteobacteria bacterium]
MKSLCIAFLTLVLLSMVGCSTTIVRRVDLTPPKQSSRTIPEEQLLDVGVVVFDSNVPELYDDIIEANITPEVRRAEANWIVNYAKEYLQATGNWGAVRAIPTPSLAVDVLITGGILHSDGESQVLQIKATDSRGVVWFDDIFEARASKYSYEAGVPRNIDPFQTNYRELSDKLLKYQESLTPEELLEIRSTTLVRYGKDVVPEAFGDYVLREKNGRYRLNRLPTPDDPTMSNVRQLLERELVIIDTLDESFDRFATNMDEPYWFWREQSYPIAIAFREERQRSKTRIASGIFLAIIGAYFQRQTGGLSEIGGYASVIGGGTEILGGVKDRAEAKLQQERLHEIGTSAAQQISPMTIELENATITLQGSFEEQYEKAVKFIRETYRKELGIISDPDSSTDESTGEGTTDEFIQDPE